MLRMLVVDLLLLLARPADHDSLNSNQLMIPSPTHIFLLAGQSNMAGRGGVSNNHWDGIIPPESQPNPAILRFSADLRWVYATEPLHADIDVNKTDGVGPGMAFANAVAANYSSDIVVGLVPCAVGGTNISQWEKGGGLYEKLVERAVAAGTSVLKAMLWYQGESDTTTVAASSEYGKKLKRMVRELRWDLKLPYLPIIQVALASGEGPYLERVREAQLGLNVSNVVTVDAKGLPLQPDRLHLTTEAQVQLGKMLAQAYFNHFPITTLI